MRRSQLLYVLPLILMLGATDVAAQCRISTSASFVAAINGAYDSAKAWLYARLDDARAGQCARGVANILENQGFDINRGHAYTWPDGLTKAGWKKVPNCSASNAPVGAVLVFDRNNPPGASGGAKYGHVEIVSQVNGNRTYISDKARTNSGGSVPKNFVGCYVPP